MVVLGDFSVKLVDAETRVPFKEHLGPSGEHYAEIEPETEYFLQVEVLDGETEETVYYVEVFIDGKQVNLYWEIRESDGPRTLGLASQRNGVVTETAWRVVKPQIPDDNQQPNTHDAMMGKVEVYISEAVFNGMEIHRDFAATQQRATMNSSGATAVQTKAALCSTGGTTSTTTSTNLKAYSSYIPGELLQGISINYCTAFGLIHAGVLPKPPLWDFHRMTWGLPKRDTPDHVEEPPVPCKRLKFLLSMPRVQS